MRAERAGKHISGAERLVTSDLLESVAIELVQRALQHPRGSASKIHIQVDCIKTSELASGRLPDLYNNQVVDWQHGRELAREILIAGGVSSVAVDAALQALASGPAPDGQSMRGAMLIDADSGARLEKDQTRGVRVSRMDLAPAARQQLLLALEKQGLNNPHVIEALTLAAKVIAAPTIIAELCWSDDPDYLAGYVASKHGGYQRISLLKPADEERGGRAFFVRSSKERLGALVRWLEGQPFLIERIGRIYAPRYWKGDV